MVTGLDLQSALDTLDVSRRRLKSVAGQYYLPQKSRVKALEPADAPGPVPPSSIGDNSTYQNPGQLTETMGQLPRVDPDGVLRWPGETPENTPALTPEQFRNRAGSGGLTAWLDFQRIAFLVLGLALLTIGLAILAAPNTSNLLRMWTEYEVGRGARTARKGGFLSGGGKGGGGGGDDDGEPFNLTGALEKSGESPQVVEGEFKPSERVSKAAERAQAEADKWIPLEHIKNEPKSIREERERAEEQGRRIDARREKQKKRAERFPESPTLDLTKDLFPKSKPISARPLSGSDKSSGMGSKENSTRDIPLWNQTPEKDRRKPKDG